MTLSLNTEKDVEVMQPQTTTTTKLIPRRDEFNVIRYGKLIAVVVH
jgi:hypothetical protein